MKAILLSIKPKWLSKILNGIKKGELRKNHNLLLAIQNIIKEYGKCILYLYCSKGKPYLFNDIREIEYIDEFGNETGQYIDYDNGYDLESKDFARNYLNGKVVAQITIDHLEPISFILDNEDDGTFEYDCELCLTQQEIFEYLEPTSMGYIIPIQNLKIFDKPKELSEFNSWVVSEKTHLLKKLTKAPQNFTYVEKIKGE